LKPSWRFRSEKSDLTNEIRSDNSNINGLIPYQFNKVGINNFTLMNIDKTITGNNEWRASDLSKQLNTVTHSAVKCKSGINGVACKSQQQISVF
jgi:hypothetical protein